MTWHMQIQTVPFGSFTDVDMVALCLQLEKLQISYSHPHTLTFRVAAANHTAPLARNAFIRLWDSSVTTPDGATQSATNPLFEGFLEDVKPGENGITVEYTAYDPTHLTAKVAPIMSAAWNAGDIATLTHPTKGTGVVPRLVLNCTNDADDDYAFARNTLGTAGQLIAGILDDQYQPLYWINAVPGDGTNAGNGVGYVWTGELQNLSVTPQEKLVHETDTVRSAISQILTRFNPEWRMYWQPGARKWRFANLTAAAQLTLWFNDPGSNYKILSGSIEPTTEGRYGAIEFRGPETTEVDLFSWYDGGSSNGIVPIGAPTVLQVYTDSSGSHNANAYTAFQIVNPAYRRGAKLLPYPYELAMGGNIVSYRGPVLQLSFDGGATWTSSNSWFDHYNGIAYWFQAIYIYQDPPPRAGSTQQYFPPNAARLLWAPYVSPLTVRSPSSGFVGTSYTVGNLAAEYVIYDEALAVGYEYGTPVTTAYRRAQFQALADSILAERKDIGWMGQLTLPGPNYAFMWLGLRINLAAKDGSGNTITTGWESINAWLTDVEYDFDQNLTTITLNSDAMQNLGLDIQKLKERLKIKALQQVEWSSYESIMVTARDGLPWMAGVQETQHFDYVDPQTGRTVDSTG